MWFQGVAPAGDGALLLVGDAGTLVRYDIGSGEAKGLERDWPEYADFRNVAPAGDGALLVLGNWGTLVRYDIDSGEAEALEGDWSETATFWNVAPAGDGVILVLGANILVRYDIDSRTAKALERDWSENVWFQGVAPAGDGALLVVGDQGTLVRVSDHTAKRIAAATAETDLRKLLDELPSDVQSYPAVAEARSRLATIEGQAAAVAAEKVKAETNLADLPTGLFKLNAQREDFRAFMAACRGEPTSLQASRETAGTEPSTTEPETLPRDWAASDPDAITLACTEAWQAHLDRDRQTWWQTVAVQVPPGVLLLFLLATLGGLYRYNMRMAGFHHSRADALELLASGKSQAEIDKLMTLADALAADKVEFGKANTPADQAVEIVRAVMNRTN